MAAESLKERMLEYEIPADTKLLKKLPVIINLNGRSFRKVTSLLQKPYSADFTKLMGQVLIKLATDIEGAIFLYSFNDEITIVCRNDKNLDSEPFYANNVQKIVSCASSIASISFFSGAQQNGVKILGEPTFLGKSFVLPSFTETINYLIYRQHNASQTAISMACFYELLKKYNDADKVLKLTKHLTVDEKFNLLTRECNVDVNNYPLTFWHGMACYRAPKMIKTQYGEEVKNKLFIDDELPFFNKDQMFLAQIFKK